MIDLKQLLTRMRRSWRLLLQGSTWLMAVLSTFVLSPPIWNVNEDLVWQRFTHFIVALLVGLSFFPISIWSKRKYRRGWWILTVTLAILSVISFFYYQSTRAEWSVDYAGQRVVIGKTYTKDALDYKAEVLSKEKRLITDEELIMNYAGDLKSIWVAEELRQRRLALAAIYIALISFLAASIISLIQAL